METAERRFKILKLLCRRRYETIENLSEIFGVSERTIRRDLDALSLTEPIYTQQGRYGGGVYVTDNYYMDRMYLHDRELNVMCKLLSAAENGAVCRLNEDELSVLKDFISEYKKPGADYARKRRENI